jgi:poly(A) polymerase
MNQTKSPESSLFLEIVRKYGLSDLVTKLLCFCNQSRPMCQIWFVGGLIRDCLQGNAPLYPDFDLIVQPKNLSLAVCEYIVNILSLGSDTSLVHYFVLDLERDTFRITHPAFQMDINGIRGDTLLKDLFHRDFSINSLCYSLEEVENALSNSLDHLPMIDYFSGSLDLENAIIRSQNPGSFLEDPLRILRAFRFAGNLHGSIEENTKKQMIGDREYLLQISPERVRDEFCAILKNDQSFPLLVDMEQSHILEVFFPFLPLFEEIDKLYTTKLQVKYHTLSLISYLEQIFERIRSQTFPYWEILDPILRQIIPGGRSVEVLLKIAGLLHDIGKPSTLSLEGDRLRFFNHETVGASIAKDWMAKMKFSNSEIEWTGKMIESHMRPHNLSNAEKLTPKAQYRFFRESAELGVPLLLLALADAYATRLIPMGELGEYEKFLYDMLTFYSIPEQIKPRPCINGHEIMEILLLPPSRKIGELLEEILELQSLGQIQNKEDAITYLKNKKL